MTGKKTSYYPGLSPVKGQEFGPITPGRSRDLLSGLPKSTTRVIPASTVLAVKPATVSIPYISPRDPQDRLGPNKAPGLIGYPETSVRNYHYSLRNDPEERGFHLLRGGSPKSRILHFGG
jgi:hypothetical protein